MRTRRSASGVDKEEEARRREVLFRPTTRRTTERLEKGKLGRMYRTKRSRWSFLSRYLNLLPLVGSSDRRRRPERSRPSSTATALRPSTPTSEQDGVQQVLQKSPSLAKSIPSLLLRLNHPKSSLLLPSKSPSSSTLFPSARLPVSNLNPRRSCRRRRQVQVGSSTRSSRRRRPSSSRSVEKDTRTGARNPTRRLPPPRPSLTFLTILLDHPSTLPPPSTPDLTPPTLPLQPPSAPKPPPSDCTPQPSRPRAVVLLDLTSLPPSPPSNPNPLSQLSESSHEPWTLRTSPSSHPGHLGNLKRPTRSMRLPT